MDYLLWKNPSFWNSLTCCFYSLEKRFFILEYRETHYAVLFCLKKRLQELPTFDKNHGLNPLEKYHFFEFFYFFFLLSTKAFFSF